MSTGFYNHDRLRMTAVGPDVPEKGRFPVPQTSPCRFTVTLSLSAVLPTGNGRLQWTPLGGRPVASWDFEVQID